MLESPLKIPQEWRESVEEIASHGGPVLTIGAPGSGKTTFCLYLTGLFCRSGKKVAFIDADPGQPFIGPPSVISLTAYTDATDLLKRRNPMMMSFIGNTSPVGRLLDMISGLQKLYSLAQSLEPDLVLINTCGLVNGGAARELKFHEIDMLSPRSIIALQNGNRGRASAGPACATGRIAHSSPPHIARCTGINRGSAAGSPGTAL